VRIGSTAVERGGRGSDEAETPSMCARLPVPTSSGDRLISHQDGGRPDKVPPHMFERRVALSGTKSATKYLIWLYTLINAQRVFGHFLRGYFSGEV
jgi:hypothetical protein